MLYRITVILMFSICANSSFAASSGEEWLAQQKAKMLAAPDTLDSAIENNWFQIPQKDLLQAKVERAYESQVRPRLDAKLGAASATLRSDIETRLNGSSFEALEKWHQKSQISWCDWIWKDFLSDGRPPSPTDTHDALYASCRTMAKEALSDIVLSRAHEYPVNLSTLPNLDDQFPAWIVADLGLRGKDASQNKPIDVATLQASYANELKKRFDAIIDPMQSTIDAHFAAMNWKTAKPTSTNRACEKLLGDPNRLLGVGQAFLEALSKRCYDQSEAWLTAQLSAVSGRVSETLNSSAPPALAISIEGVCQTLVSSWVATGEAPVDFVSKAERLCAANPAAIKRSEESKIAAIRDLETPGRQLKPTVDAALASGWMRVRPETVEAHVTLNDPLATEVVAELKRKVDAKFDQIRQGALADGRQHIDDNYRLSIDDNGKLAEARAFCQSFHEKNGPEASELEGACKHAEESFKKQRSELALRRSGADDSKRLILIGKSSTQIEALVDDAALNGFQASFDGDRVVFYPFGARNARLTGRLMKSPDSSNQHLTTIDPIPGYGAARDDVEMTINCIISSYGSMKYDINRNTIDDIINNSIAHAAVHGVLLIQRMEECIRARDKFTNFDSAYAK